MDYGAVLPLDLKVQCPPSVEALFVTSTKNFYLLHYALSYVDIYVYSDSRYSKLSGVPKLPGIARDTDSSNLRDLPHDDKVLPWLAYLPLSAELPWASVLIGIGFKGI